MAIIKEQSKTFPLWFQDEVANANYSDEFDTCLQNLPKGAYQATASLLSDTFPFTPKYWGAVVGVTGTKIYCIPRDEDNILVVDTLTDTTSTIATGLTGSVKFCGGVLAKNGKIYCIPYNATVCMIIDTNNDTVDIVSLTGFTGTDKFQGGYLMDNGKLYCTPASSAVVLVIDTTNDTTYTFACPVGALKWASMTYSRVSNKLYAPPCYATEVLIIDPVTDTVDISTITGVVAGTDKYYSSVESKEGFIYCGASSAGNILKIDPSLDTISYLSGATRFPSLGMGVDGNIYSGGVFSTSILKLDTSTDVISYVSGGTDYQFATVTVKNGDLYTLPLSGTKIAKLELTEKIDNNNNFALSRFNNKF